MRFQFNLGGLLILLAVAAAAASMGLPSLVAAQRTNNERNASASLRSLATAQRDFRENDRDGNGVVDYWTADIAGLSIVRPIEEDGSPSPQALRLILPSLAGADGDFAFACSEYTARMERAQRPFCGFQSNQGYFFRAARTDGIGHPPLRDDTDDLPQFGAVHNRDRFAMMTYPASATTGRVFFIVDQDLTEYKGNVSGEYRVQFESTADGSRTRILNSGSRCLDSGAYPANPCAVGFSKFD